MGLKTIKNNLRKKSSRRSLKKGGSFLVRKRNGVDGKRNGGLNHYKDGIIQSMENLTGINDSLIGQFSDILVENMRDYAKNIDLCKYKNDPKSIKNFTQNGQYATRKNGELGKKENAKIKDKLQENGSLFFSYLYHSYCSLHSNVIKQNDERKIKTADFYLEENINTITKRLETKKKEAENKNENERKENKEDTIIDKILIDKILKHDKYIKFFAINYHEFVKVLTGNFSKEYESKIDLFKEHTGFKNIIDEDIDEYGKPDYNKWRIKAMVNKKKTEYSPSTTNKNQSHPQSHLQDQLIKGFERRPSSDL